MRQTPAFFTQRPVHGECNPYYFNYISLVPDGNLLAMLPEQHTLTQQTLRGLSDDAALFRPAPEEWSIKQVIGHLIDTERLFSYRMLHFARADSAPLPSMEPNPWMEAARFDDVPVADLLDEFAALRAATVLMLAGMDETMWGRGGVASNSVNTVRAVGWTLAGHELHHMISLREKYLRQ